MSEDSNQIEQANLIHMCLYIYSKTCVREPPSTDFK